MQMQKNPSFPTKNSSVKSILITMTSCDNINAMMYSKKLSQMLLTPHLFIFFAGQEMNNDINEQLKFNDP